MINCIATFLHVCLLQPWIIDTIRFSSVWLTCCCYNVCNFSLQRIASSVDICRFWPPFSITYIVCGKINSLLMCDSCKCFFLFYKLVKCWTLCCREVFHVVEDVLCVPKLTCTLPTCTLRVINNDTLEEIPRVFLRVVPHVYRRNSVRQCCFL